MFLIKISEDQKYWCDKYDEVGGFLIFTTRTRDGKEIKHQLRKELVAEIIEADLDNEREVR